MSKSHAISLLGRLLTLIPETAVFPHVLVADFRRPDYDSLELVKRAQKLTNVEVLNKPTTPGELVKRVAMAARDST